MNSLWTLRKVYDSTLSHVLSIQHQNKHHAHKIVRSLVPTHKTTANEWKKVVFFFGNIFCCRCFYACDMNENGIYIYMCMWINWIRVYQKSKARLGATTEADTYKIVVSKKKT